MTGITTIMYDFFYLCSHSDFLSTQNISLTCPQNYLPFQN